MLYWETADQDAASRRAEREFAALWKRLPEVVFSTSTSTVRGSNTRLASGDLTEEIERLRAEPTAGDVATLAAAAAASGLIDEYRVRVYPVLVGGGTPFFPRHGRRVDLHPVESRTLSSGVVHLRYRSARDESTPSHETPAPDGRPGAGGGRAPAPVESWGADRAR